MDETLPPVIEVSGRFADAETAQRAATALNRWFRWIVEGGGGPPPDAFEPLGVSTETLALLTAYSWPGNVRELENVLERAVALARGASITPEDLPERVRTDGGAAAFLARARERRLTLREVEREYILETLRETGGNKSRAAERLGLDRKTLYRRLDEYRGEDPTLKI